ncbi:helix-turn-helix domain-containing protein [Streptomyces inhibens]|uniref:Helix-turn-helix domain-containing protein n=1 Tax=Streptomyces inhibens TaxID=2293571 RepID=A0A371PXB4_STRIH|nr:helix-turn-helix transcriptional regulator [Streptomyces inhibens]REK87115.1 helix-turn-helix domain-containing protein [Streptomyces inhibens]
MQRIPVGFGAELRRRRIEAGLSLGELATLICFSKGHLSKIERGVKSPSHDLAQLCDSALDAGGQLSSLISTPGQSPAVGPLTEADVSTPWTLRMHPGGESDFVAFDPASLVGGAMPSTIVSWSIAPPFLESGETNAALPYFREAFDEFRRLGQIFGPAVVAQLCIAATSALRGMAHHARPAHRDDVLRLASRFAEYTGWMAQEAGSDAASLWWTEQAVQLAADGGDDELAAYALVRRAELALYSGDSVATVQLARRAAQQARSARIRGLAAQREAQGHALVGDRDACRRALDRGAELTSGALPPGDEDPVLGSIHLPDLTAFVAGWCMHDLGSPAEAVTLLGDGLDAIPLRSRRARARYGARLALALANVGEIEQACAIAELVASHVALIDSATIRADLLRLSRALNRWPKNPTVRRTLPHLAIGLHTHRTGPVSPA